MNRQSIDYLKMCDDIQELLSKRKIDDAVPALCAVLSHALYQSGQDKKKCISYVVNTIDWVFERKSNEKKNHS